MIDTHCHVDLYPNPTEVADQANKAGVLTVIVTNLPSAFERASAHVRSFENMRLALGLHPLESKHHAEERQRFRELIDQTSYIGEIGLDFSRLGFATKKLQQDSLRFILRSLAGKPKFITLHSRQAETEALDILEQENRSPVVFHWFSGSQSNLRRLLANGHFCSVNPAMLASPNGNKIIDALPPHRVLTESDGPFIKIGKRAILPHDVGIVEDNLGARWQMSKHDVRARIKENFLELVRPLRK